MSVFRHTILLFVIFYTLKSQSQNVNLKSYEWENRIVLLISEDNTSQLYKTQLEEFKKDNQGFAERKLLVFDVFKDKYRKITYKSSNITIGNWQSSKKIFTNFSDDNESFKVVLIGLDGGVKNIFNNEILTKETLFTIIDGMFMRRQELKRKN